MPKTENPKTDNPYVNEESFRWAVAYLVAGSVYVLSTACMDIGNTEAFANNSKVERENAYANLYLSCNGDNKCIAANITEARKHVRQMWKDIKP